MGGPAEGADRRAARSRSRRGCGGRDRRACRGGRARDGGRAGEPGSPSPRVTSDAKHVEIGLTDKSDSARWIVRGALAPRRRAAGSCSSPATSSGRSAGMPGSDSLMLVPERTRGRPSSRSASSRRGARPASSHLGGGPDAFLALLEDQLARRERRRRSRRRRASPAGRSWSTASTRELERVHETLLTLADGRDRHERQPRVRRIRPPRRACSPPASTTARAPTTALLPAPVLARPRLGRAGARAAAPRPRPAHRHAAPGRCDAATAMLRRFAFSSLARPGAVALRPPGRRALSGADTGSGARSGGAPSGRASRRDRVRCRQRRPAARGRSGRCRRGPLAGDSSASAPTSATPTSCRPRRGAGSRGAGVAATPASSALLAEHRARLGATLGGRRHRASTATTSCSARSASRSST